MREILFLSGLGMALKTPCESCKNLEKGITKEMGKGYETVSDNSFFNICKNINLKDYNYSYLLMSNNLWVTNDSQCFETHDKKKQ